MSFESYLYLCISFKNVIQNSSDESDEPFNLSDLDKVFTWDCNSRDNKMVEKSFERSEGQMFGVNNGPTEESPEQVLIDAKYNTHFIYSFLQH